MSTKYQYGRGLPDILRAGMVLSLVLGLMKELNTSLEPNLLVHSLFEVMPLEDEKAGQKFLRQNIKDLKASITPRIERINESIQIINKTIEGLDFKDKLPELNHGKVIEIVEKRLSTMYELPDVQKITDQNFRLLLNKQLSPSIEAIEKFRERLDSEQYEDDIRNLKPVSRAGMKQAFHVCSIGYYSTSVFIGGRTVEECLNMYCEKLFLTGELERFGLGEMTFKNKIDKLHSLALLDEALYHELSSTRISRNDFGHPSTSLLTKPEAHLRLRSMCSILMRLEKKMSASRLKAAGRAGSKSVTAKE